MKQKFLIKLKFATNFNSSKTYPTDVMSFPKTEKKTVKIFWIHTVMSMVNDFTYYELC